ncbi:MAG: 23S rRNA (uracil(1939)-C(5))-methyltransferase RlmD [Bacteroidales bacterium]
MNNRPIIGPIKIEQIHSTGKGLGIWNNKNYYIPFAIPDEIIYAQTENRRLGFRTARITEIIEKSPHRKNPPCKYFGLCGGCNFMHIEYEHQLLLKKQILQNAFEKYNIPFVVDELEPALNNINYRNKAVYQIKYDAQTILVGFHPEWDHKNIIDIEFCYLLQPAINNAYKTIRRELICFYENTKDTSIRAFTIRCNRKDECQLIFELNKHYTENAILFISSLKEHFETIGIHYFIKNEDYQNTNYSITNISQTEPYLYETVLGVNLRISPLSFFQNNIEITEKMLRYISENVDFNKINVLFDLYSGNGAISLSLINHLPVRLFTIEGNLHAVNDAIHNSHGKSNHIHIHGDVLETFNQDFVNHYPKPDVLILDPPRSGTLIEIQKNILNAEPKIIVYVSCNPVSLAWNLQQLISKYKITHVKIFDMFPQTHQFETIVILERL